MAWTKHNIEQIKIEAPVERVWGALTSPCESQQYFLGARVNVGDVGETYVVQREDGWRVDGVVLAKDPPYRLRVTWNIRAPSSVEMPDSEVEYLLLTEVGPGAVASTNLTITEYVNGPVPPQLAGASRTGWSMIARNLKIYIETESDAVREDS